MSNLTPKEMFKQGLRERNLVEIEPPKVKAVKIAKPKIKVDSIVAAKSGRHGNKNALKDGWSKDPVKIAEYQREWRKKNADKIKQYRELKKFDPVEIAKRADYEKNRHNKKERLEQNKLRYHINMQDPLFVAKERLRTKLRRKTLTEVEKIPLEKQYKKAVIAWKEKHDKTK